MTLGWELYMRSLIVILLLHKFKAWTIQVESFISRKFVNAEDSISVLGRMEHIDGNSNVWPFSQQQKTLGNKSNNINKKQFIKMQSKEDFKIALNFLRKAKEGVNMNLITF